MPIIDHFGMIAPFYDRVMNAVDTTRLQELVGLSEGGRLLDAAGGTGRVSSTFAPYAGQVVVADVSRGMLCQAVEKPKLDPVQTVSERLPFADGTFDAAIMVDALHHVKDQRKTALELWRVVRPGGRIVIEEPNIHHLAVKFMALGEKVLLMRSHFLAPVEIEELFRPVGASTRIVRDGWNSWVVVER